jgi:hypothetical protein
MQSALTARPRTWGRIRTFDQGNKMHHVVLKMPNNAALNSPTPHSQLGIPAHVRALAATDTSMLTLILEGSDLWVVRGSYSVHENLNSFEPFTVSFMKRAKGAGFVTIHAKPKGADSPYFTLLDFGAYSESAVEAATLFAACLQEIFGYTPAQQYWGADC